MYQTSQELPLTSIVKSAYYFKRQILLVGLLSSLGVIGASYVLFPVKYQSDTIIKVNAKQWEEAVNSTDEQTRSSVNLNFQTSELLSKDNVKKVLFVGDPKEPSILTQWLEYLGLKKKPVSEDSKIQDFQGQIRINTTEITEINAIPDKFTISFIDGNIERVYSIPQDLIKLYSEGNKIELTSYYDDIIASLQEQLKNINSKIESTEKDLSQFVQSNSLGSLLQSDVAAALAESKKSLTDVKLLITELDSRQRSLKRLISQESPTIVTYIEGESTIKPTDQILRENIAELERLQTMYTDEHPDIKRLKKDIATYTKLSNSGGSKNKDTSYRANTTPNPEFQRLKFELSNVESNLARSIAHREELEKVIGATQSKSGEITLVGYSIRERGALIDNLNTIKVNIETRLTNAQIRRDFVRSDLVPLIQPVETRVINKSPPSDRYIMVLGSLIVGLLLGIFSAMVRGYSILTNTQSIYGPIKVIPNYIDVSFIENRLNEATGLYEKLYALSSNQNSDMVLYNEDQISTDDSVMVKGIQTTRSLFAENTALIKLTDDSNMSLCTWWFKPLIILGYAGIAALIIFEFLDQYFIIPS